MQRIRVGCKDTQNIQSRLDIEFHIIFKRYNKCSIFYRSIVFIKIWINGKIDETVGVIKQLLL